MPRYDFRCPLGHTTEAIYPMAEVPEKIICVHCPDAEHATRIFHPPAAILFHGPGFYDTDVRKRVNCRRRSNPGDDLPREFDGTAAKMADAI